jgi:diguanylate cyclase (GGDEF)-like protein
VLAVPMIGNGKVTGVLLLTRETLDRFDTDAASMIGRFAPMVASVLTAATTHGNATEASRRDPLTGLGNRRALNDDLVRAAMAAADSNSLEPLAPVAIAMVDVDHFKHFNDTNGHHAGDTALKAVAHSIASTIRNTDRAYRYGGEEFAVVLGRVTSRGAIDVAERIRAAVAATVVPGGERQPLGCVTVSIGVSWVHSGDTDDAFRRADAALYAAKTQGRNRVVVDDGLATSA